MANDNYNSWGLTGRALPARVADNTYGEMRTSSRGELCVQPLGKAMQGHADEGGYFVATNPTIGTGIVGITAADGYDATETLYLLSNTATESEAVRVYLDFLEIACTVVDANGTNIRIDYHIDNISRFTSGGSAITPVNANMDSTATAKATLRFGAIVSPAASSSVRYLGGRLISSTDLVVDDVIRLDFGGGGTAQGTTSHLPAEATLSRYWQIAAPPVVLGPGDCFLFSVNCASQATTGATWSFNTGWYER